MIEYYEDPISYTELACLEFISGFQYLLYHYTDPEMNSG